MRDLRGELHMRWVPASGVLVLESEGEYTEEIRDLADGERLRVFELPLLYKILDLWVGNLTTF